MSSSPTTTRRPKRADAPSDFQVQFWGVRGSIPSPGPETSRYGGNTPCVEMRCGRERLIFDLGSGARGLGDTLTAPLKASVFLSHYHYDHLQGLPFFTPMFNPENAFVLYGPSRNGQSVQDIVSGQMRQPYFPVTTDMVFRARVEYRPFAEGTRVQVGEAVVSALELNHPGGNLGYRVEFNGRTVVYATDVEHGSDRDRALYEFAHGADLLIYDAMYTEDEYRGQSGSGKTGWGHSTWQAAVQAATRANVRRLVLFHHEPTRSDAALDALLSQAQRIHADTVAAAERDVLDI